MEQYNSSPIAFAANEIIGSITQEPHYDWSLSFKVLEGSGLDLDDPALTYTQLEQEGFFTPIAFTNIDFNGDFEKNFIDHAVALCKVTYGMWFKILSPARSFLRVYLTRTKYTRQGGEEDLNEDPLVLVFKPVFQDSGQAHDSVGTTMSISRSELDIRGMLDLEFDLLDPAAEAAQSAKCGGNWRDVRASDVMQAVFANVSSQFEFEGEPLITGQSMAGGANEKKRSHITIDSNTDLTNLPLVLQGNHGGIWPTGINRYLFNKVWYFYPPYDTNRVDKELKTFSAVIVPEQSSSYSTKTFFMDGDQLKLIATSSQNYRDLTQLNFLGKGDGLRFTEASAIAGGWVETKDNKAITKRSQFNSELRIHDESKTDHRIFQGNRRFTDNSYAQLSLLAPRRGILLQAVWRYCDHMLLRPGMAGTVYFEVAGEVKQLKAILVARHFSAQTSQQGVLKGTFVNTCAMTFFCNPLIEEE